LTVFISFQCENHFGYCYSKDDDVGFSVFECCAIIVECSWGHFGLSASIELEICGCECKCGCGADSNGLAGPAKIAEKTKKNFVPYKIQKKTKTGKIV